MTENNIVIALELGGKVLDTVACPLEGILLSDEEVAELYRYTRNDYISPNTYPHLMRLLDRVSKRMEQVKADA